MAFSQNEATCHFRIYDSDRFLYGIGHDGTAQLKAKEFHHVQYHKEKKKKGRTNRTIRNAKSDRFYCAIMPLTIRIAGYRINITCVERIDDDPLKMLKTEDCNNDAVYHNSTRRRKIMVHLWRSRAREEAETDKVASGVGATGDIAVIIDGKGLDNELVRLACLMAKKAKRKVHLVHIIEVPRTLPLKAVLTKESDNADKLLTSALSIAEAAGCEAIAEVVQARDSGPAIVDEARDHDCALILLGFVRDPSKQHNDLGKTIPYVLTNAPCRVWVVQDPIKKVASQQA